MKKAVVFDNSGTLIERYRVVKDVSTGELFDDVNSMKIIDETTSLALVVLQYNTSKLLNLNQNTLISDVIKEFDIDFDVSFTNTEVTKNKIKEILVNENSAVLSDITDAFKPLKKKVPNFELCNGSALIVNIDFSTIEYTVTSAGMLFSDVIDTVNALKSSGIEIYIASGDRKGAINKLADILGTDRKKAYGSVSPKGKCRIVKMLQDKNYNVMMVGDGINDIKAFRQADVSVLTLQQASEVSSKMLGKSDFIVNSISEILNIDF